MSVPIPVVFNSNRAAAASAKAIAVHSIAQRVITPNPAMGQQPYKISVGTAYVDIPNSMKRETTPVVYEPINKRYYPDPVDRILTAASYTVLDYKKSVSIDLNLRKKKK